MSQGLLFPGHFLDTKIHKSQFTAQLTGEDLSNSHYVLDEMRFQLKESTRLQSVKFRYFDTEFKTNVFPLIRLE